MFILKKTGLKGFLGGRFIAFLSLLLLSLILAMLFSFLNDQQVFENIPGWIMNSMFFYLVIIFIRTSFHLLFSFYGLLLRDNKEEKLLYQPLISIILPCYEEEKVIATALHSIMALDYSNYEVIVVDDGSSDKTFEKATEVIRGKKLRVIFQTNSGKANALNNGILEARGEYIFCMDADSKLDSSSLKSGIRHFLKNKKLAAVAGNVSVGGQKSILSSFQRLEYITALNFIKVAQSFLKIVTVVPGPVGLFRKNRVLEVGGYKEETFAEDCDLTLRLLMAGYDVIYEPKMKATTEVPLEFESLVKQRYRWSRGIVQAIRCNSQWMRTPKNFKNFFVIWYMIFESIVIPICNFIFSISAIILALSAEGLDIAGYYFAQLVILDLIVLSYSLIADSFSFRFIFLGIINRFTYGLTLEIQRCLAIFDELFRLPMSWGKLRRTGLE